METLNGYRDLPGWPIDIDTWMLLVEAVEAVEAEAMSLLYEIVQLLLRTVSAHFLCDVFSLQIAVRCSEVCNGL